MDKYLKDTDTDKYLRTNKFIESVNMNNNDKTNNLALGICLIIGLAALGYLLGSLLSNAAIKYKEYERTVTVKGLSEREFDADIVIWPIQFSAASNSLEDIYGTIDTSTAKIRSYLKDSGLEAEEISISSPSIVDKSAQQYGGQRPAEFRYTATQMVTVYSKNISMVRELMAEISSLGKQGIVFAGANYETQVEYIFTRLNEIKPEMVEEATRKAREVAEKFASDSNSSLGKIKKASQGQFSIASRDKNNPHIKKIRVVSTVAYYLSD